MDRAARILDRLLAGFELEELALSVTADEIWCDVVGETIAGHSRPEGIRGATLSVVVDSAPWLQQLQFFREKILAKLRERGIPVKHIRFRVGPTAGHPPPPKAVPRRLEAEEIAQVNAWCGNIEDPRLRDELARLIRLALSRER